MTVFHVLNQGLLSFVVLCCDLIRFLRFNHSRSPSLEYVGALSECLGLWKASRRSRRFDKALLRFGVALWAAWSELYLTSNGSL
jgi:hypothetical protein